MIYKNLQGLQVEGDVWSRGPVANTVWVIRSGGAAVVHATKREEIAYQAPQRIPAVSSEVEATAQKIVDDHRESQKQLAGLGLPTTPTGADFQTAVAILKYAETARRSRTPFITAHGPTPRKADIPYDPELKGPPVLRLSPSDKRLSDLAKESE